MTQSVWMTFSKKSSVFTRVSPVPLFYSGQSRPEILTKKMTQNQTIKEVFLQKVGL